MNISTFARGDIIRKVKSVFCLIDTVIKIHKQVFFVFMFCNDLKCKYFLQMVPYDLPLDAGILPRLLITIVGEPISGGDRYEQYSTSKSAFCLRCKHNWMP